MLGFRRPERNHAPQGSLSSKPATCEHPKNRKKRTISDMDESDCLRYKLKNRYASYDLGDPVRFQGKSLVIEEKSSHLSPQDGILRHNYTLATAKGSQQEKRSNAKLAGTSIAGTSSM